MIQESALAGTEIEKPITVDELLRRGVTDELEGRALDVVLRCGWPRPGDSLGIKPCIPIEMRELKAALELLESTDTGYKNSDKLRDVRLFLTKKLRTQEYLMGLYVAAADLRAG